MKKYLPYVFVFLTAVCCLIPLYGQERPLPARASSEQSPESSGWRFWGGFEIVPDITWDPVPIVNKSYIRYDFNAHAMTTYSGSVVDEDLGIRYGVKISTDDNLIGQFNDISGYFGYRDYTLRLRTSRLEGSALWKGSLAPGQPAEVEFDNRYFSLDIIYRLKKMANMMYVGGNYTSFALPMQIDTLLTPGGKENQYNGVSFYDPDYKIGTYAFIFGIDTLAAELQDRKTTPRLFSGFMNTQDSFGLGRAVISGKAIDYAEALNPGTSAVGDTLVALFGEYDVAIGGRLLYVREDVRIAIALGYNFGGITIMSVAGAAEKAGELGLDGSFDLWHHGPIFKFYAAF